MAGILLGVASTDEMGAQKWRKINEGLDAKNRVLERFYFEGGRKNILSVISFPSPSQTYYNGLPHIFRISISILQGYSELGPLYILVSCIAYKSYYVTVGQPDPSFNHNKLCSLHKTGAHRQHLNIR